jgi:putative ABC transport system ATP-binding protein
LAAYRARELAIIFQSENLWPLLTARENVLTALRMTGRPVSDSEADEALAAVGLAERGRHRVSALSGGEQQRVAIAAAAARRAPLVLADEPTGELDQRNEEIVLEALMGVRKRNASTIVIVTHSERVAAAVDRVIELRDGKVLA